MVLPARKTKAQRELELERKRRIEIEQSLLVKRNRELVQRENALRLGMLRDTFKVLENNKKELNRRIEKGKKRQEWTTYLLCENLPSIYNVPDLRKFIYKWKKDFQEKQSEQFDWLLNVDERSVLGHDANVPNRKFKIMKCQQPDKGVPLAGSISEVLKILDQLENGLKIISSSDEQLKLLQEMREVKSELRTMLNDSLNSFTYNILANIERDMRIINSTDAEYSFCSNTFSLDLFCHRMVPLNAESAENGERQIYFEAIKATIELHGKVSFEQCALRGCWLCYNHYDDLTKSFHLSIKNEPVFDLLETLQSEQKLEKNIREQEIKLMKETRAEWERKQLDLVENETKSTKNKIKSMSARTEKKPKPKSKPKKKKLQQEPPIYSEDLTTIDITSKFMALDNTMNQEFLNSISPEQLRLASDEVNLRQYRLMGGLIAIDYLDVPNQSRKYSNQIFVRNVELNPNLNYKDFPKTTSVTIKIQLPKNVCWWQQPIVCRWQTTQDITEPIKHTPKNKPVYSIKDFDLLNIPENVRLHYLITEHILPRVCDTYKFKCELDAERNELATEILRQNRLKLEANEDHNENYYSLDGLSNSNLNLSKLFNSDICESEGLNERKSVRKTVAKELFVHLDKILPLTVREASIDYLLDKIGPTSPERYLLSQLLSDIKEYNEGEKPIFKTNKELKNELMVTTKKNVEEQTCGTKESQNKMSMENSMLNENNKEGIFNGKVVPPTNFQGTWTTKGISIETYDEELNTITFRTENIGIFGFAQNKYFHLPLTNWEILPNKEVSMSTICIIESIHLKLQITISEKGYQLKIIEPKKLPFSKVIVPTYPMSLDHLKKFLQNTGFNVFPEMDAFWYIHNEQQNYDKHEAMLHHAYNCLPHFCLTHHFKQSSLNRQLQRRECLFLCRQIIENRKLDEFKTVRLTPKDIYYVKIENEESVKCSLMPAEQEFNSDIYHFLKSQSVEPSLKRQQNTNVKLKWMVSELLKEIHPLK